MFRKATPPAKSAPGVSVTDTAACQKALRLQVAPEAVAPVRSGVVAELRREAALPGFRKGKAPPELVERQYGREIEDETLRRVTQAALTQASETHQLKPVGPFEVTRAAFTDAGGLTLEATVEVEPSFALGDYKQIPLARPAADVTPEEVERALGELRESAARLVPAAGGEDKARQLPALDDELAKDLGHPTLGALREYVEAKLREQKRTARSRAVESALCDELLRRHTFDVPPRLVDHQRERLTQDFKVRLLLAGTPEDQVEAEAAKFTEELRTSAVRFVKLRFILDRIARQESLEVVQEEVVARLWQIARRWRKDPAEVRKILDAQGLWPSVISAIRQDKTITRLLSLAATSDGAAQQSPAA